MQKHAIIFNVYRSVNGTTECKYTASFLVREKKMKFFKGVVRHYNTKRKAVLENTDCAISALLPK